MAISKDMENYPESDAGEESVGHLGRRGVSPDSIVQVGAYEKAGGGDEVRTAMLM